VSTPGESILIFSPPAEAEDAERAPSGEVRRGLGNLLKPLAGKVSEVAVDTLQQNVQAFLRRMDQILQSAPAQIGGLALDEVEIHAQLDGQGNVGISSFAGGQVAMQSGIRFVLRKR
jgi:hypothetical protein